MIVPIVRGVVVDTGPYHLIHGHGRAVHGGAEDAGELVRADRAEAVELHVHVADGGAAGAARKLRRDGSADGAAQALALGLMPRYIKRRV